MDCGCIIHTHTNCFIKYTSYSNKCMICRRELTNTIYIKDIVFMCKNDVYILIVLLFYLGIFSTFNFINKIVIKKWLMLKTFFYYLFSLIFLFLIFIVVFIPIYTVNIFYHKTINYKK